jgi:predicted lipid-binding transport protein (Tim44 family)
MSGLKVAAIAVGALIALLLVGTVIGFIIHAVEMLVIVALVVGGIAIGIKVMSSRNQVSGKSKDKQLRDDDYSSSALPRADVQQYSAPSTPVSRPSASDVDDELARLKREMGS